MELRNIDKETKTLINDCHGDNEFEDTGVDDSIFDLYGAINKLKPFDSFFIYMKLQGFHAKELAERFQMSRQAVEKKEKTIIKKLRRLLEC